MNSQKQIARAWTMYADDSGGKPAPSVDSNAAGKSVAYPSWVAGWLTLNPTFSLDSTNTDMLINHAAYPCSACQSRH